MGHGRMMVHQNRHGRPRNETSVDQEQHVSGKNNPEAEVKMHAVFPHLFTVVLSTTGQPDARGPRLPLVEPNGGRGQGERMQSVTVPCVLIVGASALVQRPRSLQPTPCLSASSDMADIMCARLWGLHYCPAANVLPPSSQGHSKSLGSSPAAARKGAAAPGAAPAAAQHMFAGGGEDPARLRALSRMVVSMLGSTEAEQQLVGARAAAGGLTSLLMVF